LGRKDGRMAQLVIEQPGVPSITVPIGEGEVMIGREKTNQIFLVADEVSRHHAKLVGKGGRFFLVDLKSLNGTYVNKQRVVERLLKHMDEIWLGSKCRIVFRDDTNLVRREGRPESSILPQDIADIRSELNRVGNTMTLIGKRGATPPQPGQPVRADAASQSEVVRMGRAYRRLEALYEVSKAIASDFDLDKRLSRVLDTVIDALDADRGFIMLKDDHSTGLTVRIARQMGQDMEASSPSMGIAGRAAIDGEFVMMRDSESDSEFSGRASIIQQKILSAMCVPLEVEDRRFGSIYIDSKNSKHVFSDEDLELFASLATQAAMAIDNVRLYDKMLSSEKQRANLGRFLSPAIVDEVMKEGTSLELGGTKRLVTTMFCDIRGSTALGEKLEPDALVELLNEHFTAMTEIIFQFKGTLDKYIGDEIMVVFGSPITEPDDASRAVRAALAMQKRNDELNQARAAEGRPELQIGIGMNTGEAIAGLIGSPDRLEFTVIGDSVNTAKRFCDLAGPGQVVIGANTHDLVEAHVDARQMGSIMLKGKGAPVNAYEVLKSKEVLPGQRHANL
jgi:adenylate cyclase